MGRSISLEYTLVMFLLLGLFSIKKKVSEGNREKENQNVISGDRQENEDTEYIRVR